MIFKGFRHVHIYLVDFSAKETSTMTCLFIKSSLGWLWHQRIAHIGMSNLKKAHKRGRHWVLDSGCSQHMIGDDSMFTSLEDPGDHDHVTYGDNSRGRVIGLGRIGITHDLSISNVLYVEDLKFNLISIAQLCDLVLTCV